MGLCNWQSIILIIMSVIIAVLFNRDRQRPAHIFDGQPPNI